MFENGKAWEGHVAAASLFKGKVQSVDSRELQRLQRRCGHLFEVRFPAAQPYSPRRASMTMPRQA
jgi:hypothetical protein